MRKRRIRICTSRNLGEKIAFERREIEKLKRAIEEANGYVDSPYITRFNKEYTAYHHVSSFENLYNEAEQADIVYLGDYHALPTCQEFHAEFIERLVQARPGVILALEMFFSRNQPALQAWMDGRISDETFLRRIEYDLEWGYPWESYRKILLTARKYNLPTFGIDCEKRNDFETLRLRDDHAAQKILSLLKVYTGRPVVVIFGESHLASRHLPARVRHYLRRERLRKKTLTVLQNLDELYWSLACDGHEGEKVAQIKPGAWCVFSSTPFIKYQAYQQAIETWHASRGDEEELDLTATMHSLIDTMLNFIQVDKYRYSLTPGGPYREFIVDVYPEVYGPDDRAMFKALLDMSSLSRAEKAFIIHHVESNGSCYIPGINAIYLGKLDVVHGAEEAAHFVHYACRRQVGAHAPTGRRFRVDVFYTRVLEEALGYFGSKLIDPGRNQFKKSLFLNGAALNAKILKRLGLTRSSYANIGHFIREHKHFERNYRKYKQVPRWLKQGICAGGRKSAIMTHELGYILGEQLYRAYISGYISRNQVARLFFQRFEQTTGALRSYLDHAIKLARLNIKIYP